MCGIAGAYGIPGFDAATAAARMNARLGHRGPDGHGAFDCGQIALAHTRLSIIDLSDSGRQPMWNADRTLCITFNGEIYNYRELAAELARERPSIVFRSQSDTEIILHAFERWGRECVHRLRGMFAFAIWDTARRELFLARDRLGIKPLYYHAGAAAFLFASEVRALVASGIPGGRIEPRALWQYLAYQCVPAPLTLIAGVRALLPGCWLVVDAAQRITEHCYWHALHDADSSARGADLATNRRRVGELLRESVAMHMVSDVPVGVFLSGGLDSSVIVGLMRELGYDPRTFTIIFTAADYDERRAAREVATHFRTDHTEILLEERDLLDQLPDAVAAMDQVSGDAVNTYLISHAVHRAGLKVALSGLGGDELFGGYPSFGRLRRAVQLLRSWHTMPAGIRTLVAEGLREVTPATVAVDKIASLLQSDGSLPIALLLSRRVLSPAQRRQLLADRWLRLVETAPEPYLDVLARAFAEAPHAGLFTRISYGEARTYTHDLLLRDTDQMSMAHGLEVRVPLLDHRLVEYVMGIPDEHKVPRGVPKRLLVETVDGLLPPATVARRKQGFALPFDPWLRGALRGFCEERLGPDRLGGRGIFDAEQLQVLWRAFLSGRRDVTWSRVWILVVLEEWIERNGVATAT